MVQPVTIADATQKKAAWFVRMLKQKSRIVNRMGIIDCDPGPEFATTALSWQDSWFSHRDCFGKSIIPAPAGFATHSVVGILLGMMDRFGVTLCSGY